MANNEWPLWEVFIRAKHGLSHRHAGSVHAPDADIALRHARDNIVLCTADVPAEKEQRENVQRTLNEALALRHLQAEKALYPESAAYMDFLLASARKAASEAPK